MTEQIPPDVSLPNPAGQPEDVAPVQEVSYVDAD